MRARISSVSTGGDGKVASAARSASYVELRLATHSSMLVLLVAEDDLSRATEVITQGQGTVLVTSSEHELTAAIAKMGR